MARLEILEYPDSRLRTVARPVTSVDNELRELAENMLETMYEAAGIGLAATQVDVHQRLLVLDVSETRDQGRVLINPEILDRGGEQRCEEGCLSVPEVQAEVTRAEWIKVRALDVEGSACEHEARGLEAVCIQHEIAHLDGKLFVDYLSPIKRERLRKKLRKQQRQAAPAAAI